MTGTLVVAVGNATAHDNFVRTVQDGVPLERIKAIDGEAATIVAEHGNVRIWGFKPEFSKDTGIVPDGQATRTFKTLTPDTLVVFVHGGRIIARATVHQKLISPKLANGLWGPHLAVDRHGREHEVPFEHIVTLRNFALLDLAYADVVAKLNRATRKQRSPRTPMRATLLSGEEGDALTSLILEDEPIVSNDAQAPTPYIGGVGDATIKGMRHQENQAVRQLLLGAANDAACRLCQRQLPGQYLDAAHIKPRREVDAPAVENTIILCQFGCHAAFDRGDLGVHNGRIHVNPTAPQALRDAMAHLDGKAVAIDVQEAGFEWHWHNIYRGGA